jgi:hypothetical protein
MPRITVWVPGHRPFLMGGDVHALLKAEVEADGPHDLGKGYSGYVVTTPSGKTHVAEATTGALIGPSLRDVRADIRAGKPAVMKQQIAEARVQLSQAVTVPLAEFWQHCPGEPKQERRLASTSGSARRG